MEVLASMLEAVEEIVDIAAPALLPPEQLAACTERLRAVLAASGERRAERHARRQAEDFDAEEAEALAVRARAAVDPRRMSLSQCAHRRAEANPGAATRTRPSVLALATCARAGMSRCAGSLEVHGSLEARAAGPRVLAPECATLG
jgi:hypothetical protein